MLSSTSYHKPNPNLQPPCSYAFHAECPVARTRAKARTRANRALDLALVFDLTLLNERVMT